MRELRKADPLLEKILPPPRPDVTVPYVRSVYALPMAEGGRLWFSTLTRRVAELDAPMPERVPAGEALREGETADLIRGGFLVPEGKDESAHYMDLFRILHALTAEKGVKGYTILPTTVCNARCVYCFEEGRRQVTMTRELTEQTIRYIMNTRRSGETELHWFGGEPLAAAHVIDTISGALTGAGVPFTGDITTNGSLIDAETADRMAGPWRIRHAQVSMDGDEADYTARKRYLGGNGQYRAVLRAVRMLAEREIRVSVRCNVDEANLETVPAFLADLAEAAPDRRNIMVYLSPLNAARSGNRGAEIWRGIAEARQMIRDAGFGGTDSRFTFGNLRNFHCMADLGSVVIAPDGRLYSCEHCPPESCFGTVADGGQDPAERERFCRTDRLREKCRGCPFLPVCTPFASCPVQEEQCREIHMLRFRVQAADFLSGADAQAPAGETSLPEC